MGCNDRKKCFCCQLPIWALYVLAILGSICLGFVVYLFCNNFFVGPIIDIQTTAIPECKSNIKVLNWNIFAMSGKPFLSLRVEEISQIISQYDIILFQEHWFFPIFGSSWKINNQLHIEAQKLKYNMVARYRTGGRFVGSGLSIITRYPITEYGFKRFSSGAHADKLASKGIPYSRIRISKTETLAIFVTHAQATYELIDTSAEEVQREQIDEMMQFIAEKANKSEMVLFAGDFNTTTTGMENLLNEKAISNNLHAVNGLPNFTAMTVYDEHDKAKGKHPMMFDVKLEKGERIVKQKLDWVFSKNIQDISYRDCGITPKSGEIKSLSDHKALCLDFRQHCEKIEDIDTFE